MILKRLSVNHFQWSSLLLFFFAIFLNNFPARIYSDDLPEFKVHLHTLESGMKIHLKEDHSSPLVVFALVVGVGSRTEGALSGSGVSHLLEHLVFGGDDETHLSKIAENIEIYGGEINAYTTADFTLYYISIPKDSAHAGLKALADSLRNPSLDSASIEKEKKVVLHEIQMGDDDPMEVLQKLFWQTAYRLHPYRMRIIGFPDLLQQLTVEDLTGYFNRMYVPENMALTVVGDFNSKEILKIAKEELDFLKRKAFLQPMIPDEPDSAGPRRAFCEKKTQMARIIMGFNIPGFNHPDTISLDVLSVILGDGTQSRLYRRLQEDLGITRQITASTTSLLDSGLFLIGAVMPQSETRNVEKQIEAVIESVKKDGISEEELIRAKKRILNDFYSQLQSLDRQAFWIAVFSFLTGNADYLEEYLKRIQAVSRQDVLDVAQRYFSSYRKTVCTMASLKKGVDQGQPSKAKTSDVWGEEQLQNGIKVLLLEDHSVPLVSIQAIFRGGLIDEKEESNGIFQLMVKTAIRGTSSRNANELLGFIESSGGNMTGFVDSDLFGFSLEIPKASLKDGLRILADVLKEAVFPESEIQKQKKQSLDAIRQIQDSPLLWGLVRLKKILYGEHPYRFLVDGSPDAVQSVSREDLLKLYQTFVRPDHLILSVAGDVSRKEILAELGNDFGKWRPHGEEESPSQKGIKPRGVVNIHDFRDQEQSIMMIGFLGVRYQDQDRYVLDLLSHLFSGFGSPLFKKVREELGAAYYVGAVNGFGLDPGMFIIYSGTTPENESKVLETVEGILDDLRKGRLEDKDILRAKNQWMAERVRALQTLEARALNAAENKFYLGYIEKQEMVESRIKGINKEDLIRVARKYLGEENKIILTVSPGQKNQDEKK